VRFDSNLSANGITSIENGAFLSLVPPQGSAISSASFL
jgi:hypothetical protein